ncbi:MAG: hypothetical protein AB1646_04565 [Thermodesulfobacteriota bacterium]
MTVQGRVVAAGPNVLGRTCRLLACALAAGLFFFPDFGQTNMVRRPQVPALYGGAPSPRSPNQNIRMESQDVAIRLKKDLYTVEGEFRFLNTGEKTTEWVGFPMRHRGEFHRFEAWVDDRKAPLSREPSRVGGYFASLWDYVSRRPREDLRWLATSVTFPGHTGTTMRVSYDALYAHYDEPHPARIACYIYGTGSLWKDHIGKATFTVDASEVADAQGVRASFSFSDKHGVRESKVSDKVVRYEITDFEPDRTGELEVSLSGRYLCRTRISDGPVLESKPPGVPDESTSSALKTVTGQVIASAAGSLSIRPTESLGAGTSELLTVTVGANTKLVPLRWPAVRELVEVAYRAEHGSKSALTVKTINPEQRWGLQFEDSGTADPSAGATLRFGTLTGEVVTSAPTKLSLRPLHDGDPSRTEPVAVTLSLKTKFVPFRRPAVGEIVTVHYETKGDGMFAYAVKVVEDLPATRAGTLRREPGRVSAGTQPGSVKTIRGAVTASSPGNLSIREVHWAGWGRSTPFGDDIHLRVGPQTAFLPARWPAVRDEVEVECQEENGVNVCATVRTVRSYSSPELPAPGSRGDESGTATPPSTVKTVTGQVTATSPTALSIRATGGIVERVGELLDLTVDRRTKFASSRRPQTGLMVEVGYRDENGVRFADSVLFSEQVRQARASQPVYQRRVRLRHGGIATRRPQRIAPPPRLALPRARPAAGLRWGNVEPPPGAP